MRSKSAVPASKLPQKRKSTKLSVFLQNRKILTVSRVIAAKTVSFFAKSQKLKGSKSSIPAPKLRYNLLLSKDLKFNLLRKFYASRISIKLFYNC